MQRIMLAVGDQGLEEAIRQELASQTEYKVIEKAVVYREGVQQSVINENPDIIILREGLIGTMTPFQLIKRLRLNCTSLRIICLCEKHNSSDFVRKIAELGVYDIIEGGTISLSAILHLVYHPQTFADIAPLIGLAEDTEEDSYPEPDGKTLFVKTNEQEEDPEEDQEEEFPEPELSVLPEEERPIYGKTMVLTEDMQPDFSLQVPQSENINPIREEDPAEQVTVSPEVPQMPAVIPRRQVMEKSMEKTVWKHTAVAFVGARDGVGCTSMAFNVALSLAGEGKRVLYVDTRQEHSSALIRLDIRNNRGGIDGFLPHIDTDPDSFRDYIYRLSDDNRLSTLPPLDLLTFSGSYIELGKLNDWGDAMGHMVNILRMAYDVVICDTFLDPASDSCRSVLEVVDKVALVTTQDSHTATLAIWGYDALDRQGMRIRPKSCVIMNRVQSCNPSDADFQRFFKVQHVFKVSGDDKGFAFADSVTRPYLYGGTKWKKKAKPGIMRISKWIVQHRG